MTKYKQSLKTKVYKLNQGFITQKIGDKTTIFSGEESILFTLNETGALIFNGIKLGWDNKKINKKLMEKYKITEVEALQDIREFTKELLLKKIISED